MNLGQSIARLRKEVGLTQEKLAELCGVSRQAVTKWEADESEPSIEKIEILSNIFHVSIDELIKGEHQVSFDNIDYQLSEKEQKKKYLLYENCIRTMNRMYDVEAFREQNLNYRLLIELYKTVKGKYVNDTGKILDEYLVSNTTPEERAAVISSISGPVCSKYQSFMNYCEGNIEIAEAFDEVIAELKKKIEKVDDTFKYKVNTIFGKLFIKIDLFITGDIDLEDCSEKKIKEVGENFLALMNEIQPNSFTEKTLFTFASEVLHALDKKDNNYLRKLQEEWLFMHVSIWKLI